MLNEFDSAELINNLRHMSHPEFHLLLRTVYSRLLRSVYGVQAQSQIIQTISESMS